MNHLLDLHEEFDLADTAAAALQVVARTDVGALCEMVSNARGNLPHLFNDSEIQRTTPYERLDCLQKPLTERDITGAGACANECRALPRQSARFIMRDGRVYRQSDRCDLRRWAKTQIDPLDVAVGRALLQNFDQPPPDPYRRFAGVISFALRQNRRIEQQEQIHVRGIIELEAAELSHGDNRETSRLGAGHAFLNGRRDRTIDRIVSKVREESRNLLKLKLAGQIAKRYGERQTLPLKSQLPFKIVGTFRTGELRRLEGASLHKGLADFESRFQSFAQERGMRLRATQCPLPVGGGWLPTSLPPFHWPNAASTKPPQPSVVCLINEFGTRERGGIGSEPNGSPDHPSGVAASSRWYHGCASPRIRSGCA